MTLRETIARALMKQDMASGGCDYTWESWSETAQQEWLQSADAVLRALAQWEPSDFIMDRAYQGYLTVSHDHSFGAPHVSLEMMQCLRTVKAALRAMAEEVSDA